jgi:hypothetical protein
MEIKLDTHDSLGIDINNRSLCVFVHPEEPEYAIELLSSTSTVSVAVHEIQLESGAELKKLHEYFRSVGRRHYNGTHEPFRFMNGRYTLSMSKAFARNASMDLTTLTGDVSVKTFMAEPSSYVCMKLISRYKELRRADPGKAKSGLLDITWARELLLAAREAEKQELYLDTDEEGCDEC